MIKLHVDNRERAVIEHLDDVLFDIVPLNVGDFQFWEDDRLLMVIERKTYTDLAASIKDGRYAEQKFRLDELRSETGCSVVFFIEGKKPRKNSVVSGIPLGTLESALVSMTCNACSVFTLESVQDCILALKCFLSMDDIAVMETENDQDCEMLSLMHKKLSKKKNNSYNAAKIQQSKIKKKSHMTFENIFVQQLCMIHQSVSLKIAEKLAETYGSWAGLLNAYEDIDKTKRLNMLKDIRVDERRKVGPAASKNVYEFCYSLNKKTEAPVEEEHAEYVEHVEQEGGVCLI